MKGHPHLLAALFLLVALTTRAQSTNSPSDAEIQGQALAQKILDRLNQFPAESQTNTAVLQIKDDNGHRTQIPLTVKIIVTPTNWLTIYEAATTNGPEIITIDRRQDRTEGSLEYKSAVPISFGLGEMFTHPFAGSAFTVGDLNLEFFGWPNQKVLRHEVHRSRGCTVLQSTNSGASTNSYSKVVSWIDNETLGIVEACAYDYRGKLLKDFEPKDFKKVDGQYQVRTMSMENVQTGARTRMEFDLKK